MRMDVCSLLLRGRWKGAEREEYEKKKGRERKKAKGRGRKPNWREVQKRAREMELDPRGRDERGLLEGGLLERERIISIIDKIDISTLIRFDRSTIQSILTRPLCYAKRQPCISVPSFSMRHMRSSITALISAHRLPRHPSSSSPPPWPCPSFPQRPARHPCASHLP